ncbi:HNH endonuclease [Methylotenera sp.]|uniref:HNH endonuclease n=1 Tax=Methylotenera sp. TaxID=2051956 RepID=UPI00248995D8|nr:HNH endonuclease [Methylotenera sp.]MDI1360639.1 HNH endonuclease [Methylotenera sp.]
MTQLELKKLLAYDPLTGHFTWLVSNNWSIKVGSNAGFISQEGYVVIKMFGIKYKGHRLAWLYMTGEFPKEDTDHINGVRSDNKFLNLREASREQNLRNTGKYKTNTSGFKGVSLVTKSKKWLAQATFKGQKKFLGLFKTPEEASESYQKFVNSNHGDFQHGS